MPFNAQGPKVLEKGYIIESLDDGLYFLSNGAYNTMFMVTDEGVIAIDAPPAIGKNYLKAISEVTDKPVKYVIYSHSYKDHIGAAGNIFPRNVTYIAQQETGNKLKIANNSARPIPNIIFAKNFTLKVKNQTVLELDYPRVTHKQEILLFLLQNKNH